MGFLNDFDTFAHKVPQTRFALHETRHTTQIGRYYCIEVVTVVNHSHIINITW